MGVLSFSCVKSKKAGMKILKNMLYFAQKRNQTLLQPHLEDSRLGMQAGRIVFLDRVGVPDPPMGPWDNVPCNSTVFWARVGGVRSRWHLGLFPYFERCSQVH